MTSIKVALVIFSSVECEDEPDAVIVSLTWLLCMTVFVSAKCDKNTFEQLLVW